MINKNIDLCQDCKWCRDDTCQYNYWYAEFDDDYNVVNCEPYEVKECEKQNH